MAKKFSDRYNGRKWRWMRRIKNLIALAVLLFLVFQFVLGVSVVDGNSMLNTLQNGDLVLYTRLNKQVKVGDIVSLSLPSGEYYVKRVVAKAGDTVDIRDGVLYVNGIAETGEYIRGKTYPEEGSFTYPYTIPEGDAFVLGDNREESIDSRFFGAVNLRQIKGVLRVHIGKFFIRFI